MTYATPEQLASIDNNHRFVESIAYKNDIPVAKEDLRSLFGLPEKVDVQAFHLYTNKPGTLIQKTTRTGYNWNYQNDWRYQEVDPQHLIDSCPLFFSAIPTDYYSTPKASFNESLSKTITGFAVCTVQNQDRWYGAYNQYNQYQRYEVAVGVQLYGKNVALLTTFLIANNLFDLNITPDLCWQVGDDGPKQKMVGLKTLLENCGYSYNYRQHCTFDFTFNTLSMIGEGKLKISRKSQANLVRGLIAEDYQPKRELNLSGIKKTYDRLLPLVDQIKSDEPFTYLSFRSLADISGRSVDGVKASVIFNDLLKEVTDKKSLVAALKPFSKESSSVESTIKELPVWKEKRKAVVKSQANRAFGKLMEDYDFLKIDEEQYPITSEAIKSGELPLGTFFRKSEQYFLLNDNWDLWEEMLKKHREKAIELANEVRSRTTYEKDLMSYFYFVLRALPEYLKKMTGKKWVCTPKIVNDPDELEPPSADNEGVARKRSALTPIVDNDACTVEVPYASLAISGYRATTYCYSHDYHLLTKGCSIRGNAVSRDFESKLNGKDDYGLMFYTLTGSEQGRGYPTFLIIFERRKQKGDTKVHFHRTHPSRSKNGDYNPIHQWVKTAYNWMAGNVNKNLIKAQQGDLFFVDVSESAARLNFNAKVNSYDKHTFEKEVDFAEYDKAAKSNILGYVRFDEDRMLRHTEHDDVLVPAGTYAIHQCRSWEANPQGVWSLRID